MLNESRAIWIPNNNYFAVRNGYNPRYVILHGTAGFNSAEEVALFFKSTEEGNNPVSTHYIIDLDGHVVQCIDEKDGAYGNGYISGIPGKAGDGMHHDLWWNKDINPNLQTISIEHVKPSRDNSDEITQAQKEASFRLIEHICQRHNIPRWLADEHGGITGHYSMDPVNRSFCPGPYPWDELIMYLNREETD
jgi:N-acetyl-anhydromuramyl-L-alanine amidase AmpD